MSRSLTGALQAEFAKQALRPIVLVQAQFSSGTIYVWSGVGTLSWDSKTWTGVGSLGGISAIGESTEAEAQGIVLSLNGIPSDLIGKALDECRINAPVTVWFGAVSDAGAVIADPYLCFQGRMDVPEIQEGAETSTIQIRVENRLIDLGKPRERRFTHEDQQIDYAGDLGFEYVASLQEWDGTWGKAGTAGPGTSPSLPPWGTPGPPPPGWGGGPPGGGQW